MSDDWMYLTVAELSQLLVKQLQRNKEREIFGDPPTEVQSLQDRLRKARENGI